jgi:hypothetical protein
VRRLIQQINGGEKVKVVDEKVTAQDMMLWAGLEMVKKMDSFFVNTFGFEPDAEEDMRNSVVNHVALTYMWKNLFDFIKNGDTEESS